MLPRWNPIGYHGVVDTAAVIRQSRQAARLTLRDLAERAGTSHSALAAYEAGRKTPALPTLERILRAAGFDLVVRVRPAIGGLDHAARGRELADVLHLAEQFPARHTSQLRYPVFGRR